MEFVHISALLSSPGEKAHMASAFGGKADIAQVLLQCPSVTALFDKGSQTVLSGIRHGDITEILDGPDRT
jgi:hypothetical protein